jgi:DNA primase
MPGIDYRKVRERIGMSDVLAFLSHEPSAVRGSQLRGPCPIHGSSSPKSRSFSVNLATNAFKCFSCGASGNQLDLWSAVQKLPLHAAAVDLCERLNVDIPWIESR